MAPTYGVRIAAQLIQPRKHRRNSLFFGTVNLE
jgi:hypothetical protein